MYSNHVGRLKSLCDELAQHLECPVCLHFAKPPVKQCVNGHICCFSCGRFLTNCPTCRDPFRHRNTVVNSIVYSCFRRCLFRRYGCWATLNPTEYDNHVENCARRKIFCKICHQKVYARKFENHVFAIHEDKAWMAESNVLYWTNFNFLQNSHSIEVIKAFDRLFWYCFTYNVEDRSFNFAVQFIGPKKEAKKYIYEVDSDPYNGSDNRIMFKRITHHYADSVKYTLLIDGISIHKRFIASITHERSFILHLKMHKKEEINDVRVLLSGS